MLFDARVTHAGASTTSKDASQCRLFFHFVRSGVEAGALARMLTQSGAGPHFVPMPLSQLVSK